MVKRLLTVLQSRSLRVGFLLLAATLAVGAVWRQRGPVGQALDRLQPGAIALAAVAGVANVLLSLASWRAVLADLGSRLPWLVAARVFLLGQLARYVPGSVWQFLAAAELGSDHGVPRRRTASALVVAVAISMTAALLLVVALLPLAPGVLPPQLRWLLLLVPLLVAGLHPRVVGPCLDFALRLMRREPLEHHTSMTGTAVATGWALASWLAVGAQIVVLCVSLGAPAPGRPGGWRTLALGVGGYCLAWVVGFLVVFAPAGAGAREVALAAVLAGLLGTGGALVAVLASRLLLTAADVALAGLAVLSGRWVRAHHPAAGSPDPPGRA